MTVGSAPVTEVEVSNGMAKPGDLIAWGGQDGYRGCSGVRIGRIMEIDGTTIRAQVIGSTNRMRKTNWHSIHKPSSVLVLRFW